LSPIQKRRKIMFRIKNSLVALGFFLALSVCASTASYAQGAKPPSDVNVVNTPNVNVANTPTVNVGNTPGVSIVNTEANPAVVRDAADPARHAFHRSLTIVMSPGETAGSKQVLIPAGKRLVVEYLTVEGLLPAGQYVRGIVITTTVAGKNASYRILPLPAAGLPGVFAADKPVRIYADSGGFDLSVAAFREGNTDSATFSIALAGYLVDVQ
jgi:hypothetical protein